jgi:hypothetical protein
VRIAFVEVRDKTGLFLRISERLQGHEVHWLVQNRAFVDRRHVNLTTLPYPRGSQLGRSVELSDEERDIIQRVAVSDRFVVTFGRDTLHYGWYLKELQRWLDRVRPDLIFGEVGNFHSHLLALLAEKRGIPFLNPMSSRYPVGRFSFFLFDRLVPVGGDEERMDDEALSSAMRSITQGTLRPDYMAVKSRRRDVYAYKMRLLVEYARGERFATQNPIEYGWRRRSLRKVIARWESQALDLEGFKQLRARRTPIVLYPLQMQPEVNLDVWGYEHRDQVELLRHLYDRVDAGGGVLVVKPNPKSFHEMSDPLLDMLSRRKHAFRLDRSVRMEQVIHDCDLVVTVTGTVAIERLISRRPVEVLSKDYECLLDLPEACRDLARSYELTAKLCVDARERMRSSDPLHVLRRLADSSYPGEIAEPLAAPRVLREDNLARLASSFESFIDTYEVEGGPQSAVSCGSE